ncbi:MAG TPA: GNAT family N-acetyltransferase [Micromonosporaceae bacterium]|nr:GNAT family N-acetyltransferase [Micromonosporaceae bacterium]
MAIVGDPKVTRSLSFDTRSRDEQAERLAADIARAHSEPRPDYYLAIANGDDLLVGFVRIGLGAHHSGELGYAVRADDWAKGRPHPRPRLHQRGMARLAAVLHPCPRMEGCSRSTAWSASPFRRCGTGTGRPEQSSR